MADFPNVEHDEDDDIRDTDGEQRQASVNPSLAAPSSALFPSESSARPSEQPPPGLPGGTVHSPSPRPPLEEKWYTTPKAWTSWHPYRDPNHPKSEWPLRNRKLDAKSKVPQKPSTSTKKQEIRPAPSPLPEPYRAFKFWTKDDQKVMDTEELLSPEQDVDELIQENKIINEEYKTWKKNTPYLYDQLLSTSLSWPSLTVQWFPDKQTLPDKQHSTHRLLLGTHTRAGDGAQADNHVMIAEVQLPNPREPKPADYDEDREEIGGYAGGNDRSNQEIKYNIIQRIDHPTEVNKARYSPLNPNLIATMTSTGEALVFDRTKLPSQPTGIVNPQIRLQGHTAEGYALAWSPHDPGQLCTGTEDTTIRLWDCTQWRPGYDFNAERVFTYHTSIVNDVAYHSKHAHLLGSVSDDLTFQLGDLRGPSTEKSCLQAVRAHEDAINSLAMHPTQEFLVATGSADQTVAIWDMRKITQKLHTLSGHKGAITSLEWHPHESSMLASSGYDRRTIVWDLSKVGDEQTPEDAEDGPPEMFFMHGGHIKSIQDFSWNLNDPWVAATVAEDNLLQIWKVAETIVKEEVGDVPLDDVE